MPSKKAAIAEEIFAYNDLQSAEDKQICDLLAKAIERGPDGRYAR